MQRRFADTMTEMRGLINEWSAPSGFTGEPEADVLLAVSGGNADGQLFHADSRSSRASMIKPMLRNMQVLFSSSMEASG